MFSVCSAKTDQLASTLEYIQIHLFKYDIRNGPTQMNMKTYSLRSVNTPVLSLILTVLISLFALVDHYMLFPQYNIGSVGITPLLTLEFAVMHS